MRISRAVRRAAVAAVTFGLLAGAALAGAWWARSSTGDRDIDACARAVERAVDQGDHAAAVTRCRDFLLHGDMARAGALLARAHRARGDDDAVLAWATVLGDHPEAGAVWRLAAEVHAARGDQDAALEAHQRALQIHRQADQPREALTDAYNLYLSYWRSSAFREALHYAEIAIGEARRAGNAAAERNVLLAVFTILYDIGDLAGADATLRLVLPHVGREDGDTWLYARFDEALLRQGRGELAASRTAYADVLASAPEKHELIRKAHLNMVEIELAAGQIDAAAAHLDAALALPEEARPSPRVQRYYRALVTRAQGDLDAAERALREALEEDAAPDWRWRLHHALGTVLAARGDVDGARAAYGLAIDEIEALRGALGSDELKDWLLEEKRAPYEALFALEATRGAVVEALAVAERARARTFLDAAIHAASRGTRPADASALQGAAERVEALRALLPGLRASPVVEPHPIGEVLDAVRGHHLLIYFQAQERLWLATAGASAPRLQALAVTTGELRELVSSLLAQPDDRAVAAALGAALVPDGWLGPAGSTLYVVADGVLGEVPFAALRVGDRYLMDAHAIVHVPSLNALAMLRGQDQKEYGPAVVLGDPRGNLPGAAAEAAAVARILAARPLLETAADSTALRGAARADVLHLAAHTGLADRGAWIELADARVDAGTVLAWGLRPRLTVLASCTSAAPPGAGMWGSLAAAFLAAGSRAVLATLWSVDDEVARRFVLRFYEEGGVRDPAAALARTQRAFAAGGEPPSAWAPFVLVGAAALAQ